MSIPSLQANEGHAHSGATMAGVAKQVYRLIVRNGNTSKTGTAFLVSGKRVLATNHHVVDQGLTFVAGYLGEDGEIKRTPLRLLAIYPQKDLALLEAIEDLPGNALPLAVDYPEFASDLFAIGFPAGADLRTDSEAAQNEDPNFFLPSVVKGNVSRVMKGPWLANQLQHQTPISAGYSGGPLVEDGGVVVGVSAAIHKEASGISYGVASADLARLLTACALPLRETILTSGVVPSAPIARVVAPSPDPASKQEPEKPSEADQIMLTIANNMLRRGDVVGARYIFLYLAQNKKLLAGYYGAAKTYDPQILSGVTLSSGLADVAKAHELYVMAVQPDSSDRSAGATPGVCRKSLCSMVQRASSAPVVVCQRQE